LFLDFRNGKVHILQTYENGPGGLPGRIMDIKELVGLIADWEIGNSGDTNWKIEGKLSTNPIFEPLFNVHVSSDRLEWILYHITIVKYLLLITMRRSGGPFLSCYRIQRERM